MTVGGVLNSCCYISLLPFSPHTSPLPHLPTIDAIYFSRTLSSLDYGSRKCNRGNRVLAIGTTNFQIYTADHQRRAERGEILLFFRGNLKTETVNFCRHQVFHFSGVTEHKEEKKNGSTEEKKTCDTP